MASSGDTEDDVTAGLTATLTRTDRSHLIVWQVQQTQD